MTVLNHDRQFPPAPPELQARIVVSATPHPGYPITVDVTSDPGQSARVMVAGQQMAMPSGVLRALYAVLHGIYGAGPVL